MPTTVRPLSPHLSVYRWQVQMVTSILHRATGVVLAVGSLLICAALLALAAGPAAYAGLRAVCASVPGLVVLLGWTWAFCYHLLNGVRHLLQDSGFGYAPAQFVRNSWLTVGGSLALTVSIWAWAFIARGAP